MTRYLPQPQGSRQSSSAYLSGLLLGTTFLTVPGLHTPCPTPSPPCHPQALHLCSSLHLKSLPLCLAGSHLLQSFEPKCHSSLGHPLGRCPTRRCPIPRSQSAPTEPAPGLPPWPVSARLCHTSLGCCSLPHSLRAGSGSDFFMTVCFRGLAGCPAQRHKVKFLNE